MKKDLKITIEENILEKGRKAIPNLSKFFEECLKYYLGEADGMYPIENDQEILDNIGILQAKLYINKQKFNIQESIERRENEKLSRIWRLLWNDYRGRFILNPTITVEAVEVLGVDEETLEDIMDWLIDDNPNIDKESWKSVYEKYMELNKNGTN